MHHDRLTNHDDVEHTRLGHASVVPLPETLEGQVEALGLLLGRMWVTLFMWSSK